MDDYTRPEFENSALIIIDTQTDCLDGGPFEIPGTSAILNRLQRLLNAFRDANRPIVHIVRLYKTDGSNVDVCRRSAVEQGAAMLVPGGPGSQIAEELRPHPDFQLDHEALLSGRIQEAGPNEVVIYKPRWGAFYQTPMDDYLREKGVNTLVFGGCNFPNCPRTSMYEASERDYRVVMAVDAMSGFYERGSREMHNIGVALMDVGEITKALMTVRESV
jgi:nicotinamidase-related amidase